MVSKRLASAHPTKRTQLCAATIPICDKAIRGSPGWMQRCTEQNEQSRTTMIVEESQMQRIAFEDIKAGFGAHQVIVTTREAISAKGIMAAEGATQWLAQISDRTLQQMEYHCGKEKHQIQANDPEKFQLEQYANQTAAAQKQYIRDGQMEELTKLNGVTHGCPDFILSSRSNDDRGHRSR